MSLTIRIGRIRVSMKQKITAAILTKNEEKNLPFCLKSISWVDEVIIVDDNSTDKTIILAKKAKAKIFKRKLDDFASQRNFALSQVKTPWVLLIDADERVTPQLAEEIKLAVKSKKFNGYRFPRKNVIFGKWVKYSGWYPDWQLHLFKTKKGKYIKKVHEQVKIEGRVSELKSALLHNNYQSISQYLTKIVPYTSLEAENLIDSGYKFAWVDLLKKPLGEFLRRFFAEEGYQDGIHGLALSLLQAFAELIVYLRIWEKNGFLPQETEGVFSEIEKASSQIDYWIAQKSPSSLKKLQLKIKRKLS